MSEIDLLTLARSTTENQISLFTQVITITFAMIVGIYYFLHQARTAMKVFAYAAYLVESKAPEGPWFEVAVIHHTDCGSTLLADDELRHGFAQRIGADERTLTDTAVLDPERTVRTDVDRVLWAQEIPADVRVSGHVYDVSTGLVTTVVDAKSRK